MSETYQRTALFDQHVAEGARIVPFAGWEMPVQYASVIAETKAVRESVGLFDVSHMARLTLRGTGILEFLERVTTNDVAGLVDGKGQYSLLPNPSGGCVDDIILYRVGADEYKMVVNASNHAKDVAWLLSQNEESITLQDHTAETCMIAVQGPAAVELLCSLSNDPEALRDAPTFGLVECELAGIPASCARSGYTGEDGYEVVAAGDHAAALWQALRAAGAAACGLASRDALRVEAGLPLYGHELGEDINPISVGLGWVVSKTKSFIGDGPINAARQNGTPQKLHGVRLDSKRLTMPGMEVSVDGQVVGSVTSGVYSPLLDCGIAFAFINSEVPLKTTCTVEMRGKQEPATIVNKRFFKRA